MPMKSPTQSRTPKGRKREKAIERACEELRDVVGWSVLNALSAQEIKDSYSCLVKAYNKATRALNLPTHD